jgi:hypothetical protein
MGTISKLALSGSNFGRPIQVSATGATGTTIHTTLSSTTTVDEIWLYATNNDLSTLRNLTIEYGTTGTASEITVGIPSRSGLTIVLSGLVLTGNGTSGSVIRAYSSLTNTISLVGYVNRIVP